MAARDVRPTAQQTLGVRRATDAGTPSGAGALRALRTHGAPHGRPRPPGGDRGYSASTTSITNHSVAFPGMAGGLPWAP